MSAMGEASRKDGGRMTLTSRRFEVWVDCPGCGAAVALRHPSVPDRKGQRLAGAYCGICEKAWRALEDEDGWQVIWDVSAGQRVYVLDGRAVIGGK